MLKIYAGHSENRRRLQREFAQAASAGRPCLMLVPEQFTVHAEAELMRLRPQGYGGNAEVVSFKRLARRVLIAQGVAGGTSADKALCSVVMYRAFRSLRDSLEFYAPTRLTGGFVSRLCALDGELRRGGAEPEQLEAAAMTCPEGPMRRKLSELGRITGAYRALLEQCAPCADELETAAELLREGSLDGFEIYIDGFFSFSGAQYAFLGALMERCEIFAALESGGSPADEGERQAVFAMCAATRASLCAQAKDRGVKTHIETVDEPAGDAALDYLRRNVFMADAAPYGDECPSVRFHAASDVYNEAEYAACEIARLRREGYKNSDIAVLCRSESSYRGVLDSVFALHVIPVFADRRTELMIKPLSLLLRTALDIACGEFDFEDVLTHIKTGLTPLDDYSLGRLQRYCTVWEPLPGQWFNDFTDNPDGFSETFTNEAHSRLDAINEDRRKVTEPLKRLSEGLKGTVGDMCGAIYTYLEDLHIPERLERQTEEFERQGALAQAQECAQTWDAVVKALDALYAGAAGETVTPQELRELWNCAISGYDLGRIPTSVDEVLSGTVEHVRTFPRRAVFVLGVNAGVFPASVAVDPLLGESERALLCGAGLKLDPSGDEKARNEWFYAYYGFSMPSERLYVSYRRLGDSREESLPSEFFTELRTLFPKAEYSEGALSPQDRSSAFERLVSDNFSDAKLLEYFSALPEYAARIENARLAREIGKRDKARSARLEEKLTGGGLSASPTSLETLADCRFKYFCKYVLRLKSVDKAELSPNVMGSFVHEVLEKVLSGYAEDSKIPIWEDSADNVNARVDELVRRYLDGVLGGGVRSARFAFLFGRMSAAVRELVQRLCEEFRQSAFRAEDFELKIGTDGDVDPVQIEFPGGKMRVEGRIDRVDSFDGPGGRRYIRIVDYKTGSKSFDFNDVYNGFGLQMLLYLFALTENGGERYGLDLHPAGVLYYPAKEMFVRVKPGESIPDDAEAAVALSRMGAQNGLLIKDTEVLTAMEKDLDGRFICVKVRNSGLTGNLISEGGFRELEKYVNELLSDFGKELAGGDITPAPLMRSRDGACAYCEYAGVCGFEKGAAGMRRLKKYADSELKQKIEGA